MHLKQLLIHLEIFMCNIFNYKFSLSVGFPGDRYIFLTQIQPPRQILFGTHCVYLF